MSTTKPYQGPNRDSLLVVGLGATGLSVARYLHAKGLDFAIVDSREEPPGLPRLREEIPEVRAYCGNAAQTALKGAMDLLVSPGVSLSEPWVREAMEGGARVRGDIDLFAEAAGAPIVGITGSNAKSTVTAWLGEMAAKAGRRAGVGGNIGTPALDTLSPNNELYVTELSSFQLERAGDLDLAVATVLNLTPDHLDRHGNFRAYRRAKHRIFAAARCVVFNADDESTIPANVGSVPSFSWRYGVPVGEEFGLREDSDAVWIAQGRALLLPVSELSLAGRHNIANALAALCLGSAIQLSRDAMLEALCSFSGLPHRCELVADCRGIRWINDSKATNIGASLAAIEGLGQDKNLILIAGGEGKGAAFADLAAPVAKHCKAVLLIGAAAEELAREMRGSSSVEISETLERAVSRARELAGSGDTVLLSPACASFDQFANYGARGDVFRRLVLEFAVGEGAA
ncbi:MAG: UDP-N-acetylmuramoyl-L-alanine--D-glutamate ligase [Pseudomonadota bacterium]